MRRPRRAVAVDSPDVRVMGRAGLRTRLVRAVLVASAIALLALAAASARGLDTGTSGNLPRSNGVVVIDLSLSIGSDDYRVIRNTLRRLISSRASLGLVIFSDVPYEMLPPGTPAAELEPLLRLLVPPEAKKGRTEEPKTPWASSFSAGTQISSALDLARTMLVRDRIEHGTILLLSDLVTAPADVPRLARTLQSLQRQSIAVKIVPLTPLRDGRTIFEGLLGKSAFVAPSSAESSAAIPSAPPSRRPVTLFVLGVLLLVVLAAHERFAGRLGLPQPRERAA